MKRFGSECAIKKCNGLNKKKEQPHPHPQPQPRRCHSFCSFSSFSYLACKSVNAERGLGRNTDGRLLLAGEQQRDSERRPSEAMCFSCHLNQSSCSIDGHVKSRPRFWCGCWEKKAKPAKGQLHTSASEPLRRSIREMLTFVQGQ